MLNSAKLSSSETESPHPDPLKIDEIFESLILTNINKNIKDVSSYHLPKHSTPMEHVYRSILRIQGINVAQKVTDDIYALDFKSKETLISDLKNIYSEVFNEGEIKDFNNYKDRQAHEEEVYKAMHNFIIEFLANPRNDIMPAENGAGIILTDMEVTASGENLAEMEHLN